MAGDTALQGTAWARQPLQCVSPAMDRAGLARRMERQHGGGGEAPRVDRVGRSAGRVATGVRGFYVLAVRQTNQRTDREKR